MSREWSKELAALVVLYVAFMAFWVLPAEDVGAHPCLRVTNNGTTVGQCDIHGLGTHACSTFLNDGTFGTVCVGP